MPQKSSTVCTDNTPLQFYNYARFYIGMILAAGRAPKQHSQRSVERAARWWKQRSPISCISHENKTRLLDFEVCTGIEREKQLQTWLDNRTFSYTDHILTRQHIELKPLQSIAKFLGRKYVNKRRRTSSSLSRVHTGFVKQGSAQSRARRKIVCIDRFFEILRALLLPFCQRSCLDSGNNTLVWRGDTVCPSSVCGLNAAATCAASGSSDNLVKYTALAVFENEPPTLEQGHYSWQPQDSDKLTFTVVLAETWSRLLQLTLATIFHCEELTDLADQVSLIGSSLLAGRNTVVSPLRYTKVVDFARANYQVVTQRLQNLDSVLQELETTIAKNE